MTAAELSRLAADLELDVLGAALVAPYDDTERHIRERMTRGLFADMRFTMARPETSCHPETLLEGARTVVSAARCYYEPGSEAGPDEGRLSRYTWSDAYASLRRDLDELGRRLGGAYRVLVDSNDHVDREAAVRAGVAFYGKNTMAITRRFGSWVVLGTLITDVEIDTAPHSSSTADRAGSASTRVQPVRSTSLACSMRRSASPIGHRLRSRFPRGTGRTWTEASTAATSARTCARGTAGSRNDASTH